MYYLCNRKTTNGALAQLVEHRTENPCVPGSIPGGTTFESKSLDYFEAFLVFHFLKEVVAIAKALCYCCP